MRRVRYFMVLETDADRIRVDFETERGQVIVLHVVQYETMRRGAWQPVARYDSAHGFVHLDLQTPTDPLKYRMTVEDLDEALSFAIEDLKANWRAYKRRFVGEDS
ncbi:MAG: hypothetical protein A3I03_15735 [Candidatus Rokubacteria bacterium RIFCSPLOWO2_02_FULL_68_19]|nr:MAG: hypothetical protein A3I03_15735 [Candidatus Rokubacteria bacterium RIFCSPLOWO2_02_FULL_68_19]